jgi:DNA-binding phage protein
MGAAARIYQFKPKQDGEVIELRDVAEVCKLLQRELAVLAQRPHQKTGKSGWMAALADRSGVGQVAISRIMYGETSQPRFRTCVSLLDALGWTLLASR